MTTKERYMEDLSTLTTAGVPIIVTKTREPYKALEAIEDYVMCYNHGLMEQKQTDKEILDAPYSYGRWTGIDGWLVKKPEDIVWDMDGLERNEKTKIKPDGIVDPIRAIKLVMGIVSPQDEQMGTKSLPNNGIFAMNWLHPVMDNPVLKACILEAAHRFIYEDKRLVFVLPENADVPPELHDFVCFLDYAVPSDTERTAIINEVFQAYTLKPDGYDMELISSAGAGMTGFEFENSVSRSIRGLIKSDSEITSEAISQMVLINKTEMVKRSEILEVMPQGKMSEIGGLDNLKEWIREAKPCFSEEAKAFGVDTPKGIALFGPPGTGKSASAKAIGHELGIPVVRFDVSRVFGSLVGQSESRVRMALKQIEAMAPCVAFLDEVDKAFDRGSGGGDGGVGQRVLGAILTFLQESKAPVFWIMTGNRTEGLPPELLRKGRLDEVFCVTVPNNEERLEIMRIHLRKRGQNPDSIGDLNAAVARSDGYVAAELEAAVKEAVKKSFNLKQDLTGALIAEQFNFMKPLSESFATQFEAMRVWAENNARPASRCSLQNPANLLDGVANSSDSVILRSKQRRVSTDRTSEN